MVGLVWAVNAAAWDPSPAEFEHACSLIEAEESKRVRRFLRPIDAKCALLGRIMIRSVVRETLGLPNAAIRLERTDTGKPFLASHGAPPLAFNVSHAGDWVLLGATQDSETIGVDVMQVALPGRMTDVGAFLKDFGDYFTPGEWECIGTSLRNFMTHWTLKEAYVKYLGAGIGFGLLRCDFDCEPADDIRLRVDGAAETSIRFTRFALDDEHVAAVAVASSAPPLPPVTIRQPADVIASL